MLNPLLKKRPIHHTYPWLLSVIPEGYQNPCNCKLIHRPSRNPTSTHSVWWKLQSTCLASITTDKWLLFPWVYDPHIKHLLTALIKQNSPKGHLSPPPLLQPFPLLLHKQIESIFNSLNKPHIHTSELFFWSPLTTVYCPAYPPRKYLVIFPKPYQQMSSATILQLSLSEDRDSNLFADKPQPLAHTLALTEWMIKENIKGGRSHGTEVWVVFPRKTPDTQLT